MPYRYVLLPGRHHLLTRFQARYLADLLGGWLCDLDGAPMDFAADATVVWAMTSANHKNTRRNPVPGHRREAAIEQFSQREGIRSLVVPVVDVESTSSFAALTLKSVTHSSGGQIVLDPSNTVVACSTPTVIELYQALGYRVAPVELEHPENPLRPGEVLEQLVDGADSWRRLTHPATLDVFTRYALADQVRMVSSDPVVGAEGSLTETRDYRTYSAAFEDAADRKWDQAAPFVRPGRMLDIGCATGAMLERAAKQPELAESDLIGIEVARHLFEECEHKKAQNVFANPNTFFYQRNILVGSVFPPSSIDTTLTFALTHEIFSYGEGRASLQLLASAIAEHTAPGGVWINSDVCGPAEPDQLVHLVFHNPGLRMEICDLAAMSADQVQRHLELLSPAERFPQFAADFRRHTGVAFGYNIINDRTVALRLADAMEFLSKYSYTDNWLSETHEQFCTVTWRDWEDLTTAAGMRVDPRSGPWRNDWMVQHSFAPVAALTTPEGESLDWPTTHLLLVADKALG